MEGRQLWVFINMWPPPPTNEQKCKRLSKETFMFTLYLHDYANSNVKVRDKHSFCVFETKQNGIVL